MSKRLHYRIISSKLRRFNLTWNDYKKSPHMLFQVDKEFQKWWIYKFNYDQDITWYTNPYNLSFHVSEEFLLDLSHEYQIEDPEFAKYIEEWAHSECKILLLYFK